MYRISEHATVKWVLGARESQLRLGLCAGADRRSGETKAMVGSLQAANGLEATRQGNLNSNKPLWK